VDVVLHDAAGEQPHREAVDRPGEAPPGGAMVAVAVEDGRALARSWEGSMGPPPAT
jgi:hypothetical protein